MSVKKSMVALAVILCAMIVLLYRWIDSGPHSSFTNPSSKDALQQTSDGSISRQKPQRLRIAVAMNDREFKALQFLSEQYREDEPKLEIQLENVDGEEAYALWRKAAQLGETADVMLLDNVWVNEFAALGYLQPADDFYTPDPQHMPMESLMNQVKWNGYIWGIPKDIDPYIVAIGPGELGQFNLTEQGMSSEDVFGLHELRLRANDGKYGLYWNFADPYAFISAFWAAGGKWLDERTNQAIFMDNENLAYLQSILQLGDGSSIAVNFPMANDEWQPWEQLREGRIAMILAPYSEYKMESEAYGIPWSYLPRRSDQDQAGSLWLKGRSFVVSARSEFPDMAYEWIRDMTSPPASSRLWEAGAVLPASVTAENPEMAPGDEEMRKLISAIKHGGFFGGDPQLQGQMAELRQALHRLWQGDMPLQQFAEQVQLLWTR